MLVICPIQHVQCIFLGVNDREILPKIQKVFHHNLYISSEMYNVIEIVGY